MNAAILIVEDSRTQAVQLQHLLERRGYAVTAAQNGQEALDILSTWMPALVITDIMMPVMDGYEMCQRIKSDPRLQDIPVILLTSLSEPGDVIRGLECQADNFIGKPYDEDYLIARIQDVLTTREIRRTDTAQVGIRFHFGGKTHAINSDRRQILDLLISTFENAVAQNQELRRIQRDLQSTNEQLEKSAQQLEGAEKNHRALLQSNADAMVVVDRDGIVRFANQAAEGLFGRGLTELLGRRFDFPLQAGETREFELDRPGAEPVTAEMRVVETVWEGQAAFLASLRDTSARKRAEAELHKAKEEAEAATRAKS